MDAQGTWIAFQWVIIVALPLLGAIGSLILWRLNKSDHRIEQVAERIETRASKEWVDAFEERFNDHERLGVDLRNDVAALKQGHKDFEKQLDRIERNGR